MPRVNFCLISSPLAPAALSLALLASTAALIGCDRGAQAPSTRPAAATAPPPAAVPVQVAPVTFAPIPKTIEAVGTLYADEDAILSAKVPGRISSLAADVGDRLAAGAELARIDPADYQTALDQRRYTLHETLAQLGLRDLPGPEFDAATVPTVEKAKAEVTNAKSRLDRAEKLFKPATGLSPMIPEQDYQDRKTEYEVARQEYEVALLGARSLLAQARMRESDRIAAQQRLEDTVIRAPLAKELAMISGYDVAVPVSSTVVGQAASYAVAERQVTVGNYVREGDPLFRVVADDVLRFRGAVPERSVGQVKVGQEVRIVTAGNRDKTFTGKITRIAPAVDMVSRTFQVEATFDNRDHTLRPGSFSRAAIIVGEIPGVAFVPKEALISFAGIDRTYSIKPDGKASEGKAVEHRVTRLTLPDGIKSPTPGIPVQNIPPATKTLIVSNTGQIANNIPVRIIDGPATQPAR